jgi:hypothetical protein
MFPDLTDVRVLLGKLPFVEDVRDLVYANYRLPDGLPPMPDRFGHETLLPPDGWSVLGNGPDSSVAPDFPGVGDCVFAGGAHETMLWNAAAGSPVSFASREVLADYAAVTGYDPAVAGSNPGTWTRTALEYRRTTGLLDAEGKRHRIAAYALLEAGNAEQILEALWLFGAVGLGIRFPASAMDQFNRRVPWSVVPGDTTKGGHYVSLVARRENLVCVSWGRLQEMTVEFLREYNDEAWALLSEEWLKDGRSPEGFDLAALRGDLSALS